MSCFPGTQWYDLCIAILQLKRLLEYKEAKEQLQAGSCVSAKRLQRQSLFVASAMFIR